MKLLLDTHAFIWWDQAPKLLSRKAFAAITAADADVYCSVVSVWEMQLKHARGKLRLPRSVKHCVETQLRDNGLYLLPLTLPQLWDFGQLSAEHGDPFDRMLIAQARSEGMKLVTADKDMKRYEVETLW